MKKMLTFVLVIMLLAVTACGSKNSGSNINGNESANTSSAVSETESASSPPASNKEPVTLSFGIHVANPADQEPAAYNVIQEFMKQNPDVKVDIQGADTAEHIKKMKAATQSGSLPDIFWILPGPALEMQDAGLLLNLKDFLDKNPEEATAIFPNMLKNFQKDDVQYGLPYQSLVTGFWYNKEIFTKYKVKIPETYDELLAAVKTFKQNDVVTISKGGKDAFSTWAMQGMLNRFGYFNKIDAIMDKQEKFYNPDFVKFFGKLEELTKSGAFPSNVSTMNYFQAVEMFMNGKAAMLDAGVWEATKADKAGIDAGWSWGPTFSDGAGNQKQRVVVATAPLVANAKLQDDQAKYDAVMRFFKFWYSQEGAKITLDNQSMPALAYKGQLDTSSNPAFGEVLKQIQDTSWEGSPNQPDLAVPEAIGNALNDSIYGVINGIFTPE
ncbi:ABC transporter substrate-binding protein [Cohnella sp.]|uniref:ABC transporter substrate-binding protein n=1 Tax=Cohnella sp. TaxID=1883426 RepID=UPI0035628984